MSTTQGEGKYNKKHDILTTAKKKFSLNKQHKQALYLDTSNGSFLQVTTVVGVVEVPVSMAMMHSSQSSFPYKYRL